MIEKKKETDTIACIDCMYCVNTARWYKWAFGAAKNEENYRCSKLVEIETEVDLITGVTTTSTTMKRCYTCRASYNSECGEHGLLWTPKNDKDLFKLIRKI